MPATAPAPLVAHRSTPDDIFGWFDFADVYDRAVDSAPPGSALVEVGVFLGKSLAHLAEKARDANKDLRVYGVDTWRGSEEFDESVWVNNTPVNQLPPGELLALCCGNLAGRGLLEEVTLVVSDSARAAASFADGSCHMVFIDAAHDEASVARDIAAWLPKVSPGGTLAGHDYPDRDFPGVKRAVDAAFGARVVARGSCWEVRI